MHDILVEVKEYFVKNLWQEKKSLMSQQRLPSTTGGDCGTAVGCEEGATSSLSWAQLASLSIPVLFQPCLLHSQAALFSQAPTPHIKGSRAPLLQNATLNGS